MPIITKILLAMDLECRKLLETICHTWNSKKQLKSYMYWIFMAVILDFRFLCTSCKNLARLSTLGCVPEYMQRWFPSANLSVFLENGGLSPWVTCYYNTADTGTSLWQAKLAGQVADDGVYWDFFYSRLVINIICTLDNCICPDD